MACLGGQEAVALNTMLYAKLEDCKEKNAASPKKAGGIAQGSESCGC
jgi:hypothetical protein